MVSFPHSSRDWRSEDHISWSPSGRIWRWHRHYKPRDRKIRYTYLIYLCFCQCHCDLFMEASLWYPWNPNHVSKALYLFNINHYNQIVLLITAKRMVSCHMNQEGCSHKCFTSQGLLFNSLFSYFVIVEYSKNKK